jgi:hypothetical protein
MFEPQASYRASVILAKTQVPRRATNLGGLSFGAFSLPIKEKTLASRRNLQ